MRGPPPGSLLLVGGQIGGAGAVCVNAPPGTAEGPSCSAGAVEGAADTASPGSGCWASWAGVESEAALGAAAASGAGVAESSAGAEGSADAGAEGAAGAGACWEGAGVAEVEPAPVGPSGSSTVQPVMMRSGSVRVWPSAWAWSASARRARPTDCPGPTRPGRCPERVSLLHGVGPLPRGGRGVLGRVLGGLALLGHGDGGGSGGGVLWGQGEGGAATAESEHGGDQRAGQGLLRAQRSAQVGGLDAADEADHLDHERVDEGGPEAPRDQGQHGAHQERAAEVDAGQGLLELGGAGDGVADQQDQGGGDADHQGGQGQQGRKAFEGAHGACLRSRG